MLATVKLDLVGKLAHGRISNENERSWVIKTLLYPPFKGQREVVNIVCDRNVSLDERKDMIKAIGDTRNAKLRPIFFHYFQYASGF